MAPASYDDLDCSIARTLEVIGERWSLLIVRDAFYGVRRFEDFQRDLGIARNVLSDRLTRLIDAGIFYREQYEDRPVRFAYRLTPKGKDLLPVLLAFMRWGDRWAASDGPPVRLLHRSCGHVITPVVACDHCGEELAWRDLRSDPPPVAAAAAQPPPAPAVAGPTGAARRSQTP